MAAPKKPSRVVKATAPEKKPAEAFIGNDASTMLGEETLEEFEARMKAEGATNMSPVLQRPVPQVAEVEEAGTSTTPLLQREEPEEDESVLPDELED